MVDDTRNEIYDRDYLPSRYQTQIDLPPGKYELQLLVGDGAKFGRARIPLTINGNDGTQLAMSSIALSRRFADSSVAAQESAASNVGAGYIPMASNGVQVTPSAEMSFDRKEPLLAYFEIYDPLLTQRPAPAVQVDTRLVNAETGEIKAEVKSDTVDFQQPGSSTISILKRLSLTHLEKSEYRLEVQATDSAGHSTPWRKVEFTLK